MQFRTIFSLLKKEFVVDWYGEEFTIVLKDRKAYLAGYDLEDENLAQKVSGLESFAYGFFFPLFQAINQSKNPHKKLVNTVEKIKWVNLHFPLFQGENRAWKGLDEGYIQETPDPESLHLMAYRPFRKRDQALFADVIDHRATLEDDLLRIYNLNVPGLLGDLANRPYLSDMLALKLIALNDIYYNFLLMGNQHLPPKAIEHFIQTISDPHDLQELIDKKYLTAPLRIKIESRL